MSTPVETHEFQAEARQVLDLMIHSVYSNRDIFLRELISNASDALDRLRFEAIQYPELLAQDAELRIRIEANKDARTITVNDNGIGMTRDDVIRLIGTIAKSGTKEFLGRLKEAQQGEVPPELIGQFGVGFYSSFMVADNVTLITRRAGEEHATKWESAGDGTYTLEPADRDSQGTTVLLHLQPTGEGEDADHEVEQYLEEWKIREIVKRYSDFVAYPIQMDVERTEYERDEEGKVKEGGDHKTNVETETLNSMKAIWLRASEATEEELNEFYKHVSHDWTDPLTHISASIEGTLMYRMLLFLPAKAPFDLFMREGRRGVQLYVKRVFIMDDCEALLPEYLRFVKGVVDSEDLSLNISREILQQDRQIERMRKGVTGKVLDALKQMRDKDAEKYAAFWTEFGAVLKEGAFQDRERQEELLPLYRFASTESPTALTTLHEYVARMKPGQEAVYFMTGESRATLENSPHLEAFRDKGYEVLLLTDRVDEVWTQSVFEFEGKKFQSVGKGAVELGSEEEKKQAEEDRKQKQETHASLLEFLKNTLEGHVKEVRLSSRLTNSPACLVGDSGDMSPQLEALLKAAGQDVPDVKRILELNPNHPLLERLQGIYDANREDERLGDYARLVYGQAVLAEGGQPPEPAEFSKLVSKLMLDSLGD